MFSLVIRRTLKILAVLVIETFIFGMGENHKEAKGDTVFALGFLFMLFTAILIWLVW